MPVEAAPRGATSLRIQARQVPGRLAAIVIVGIVLVEVLGTPVAAEADTPLPPGSHWHLDLARSDFGAAPALSRDDFTIEMSSGSVLSFSETRVLADGKTISRSWSGRADGTLAPFAGQAGASGSYDLHDGSFHVLDSDGTRSDAIVSFSEDEQTMIFSVTARNGGGQPFQQTLTYQRAQ